MPDTLQPFFANEATRSVGALSRKGTIITTQNPDRCISVRTEGGYITSFSHHQWGEILFCSDDKKVKTSASHAMSPVGPTTDDVQHGIPRWLEYHVRESTQGRIILSAYDSHRNLEVTRQFDIPRENLTITTSITNFNDTGLHTSLGEHLYFSVGEAQIPQIRFLSGQEDYRIATMTPNGEFLSGPFSEISEPILAGIPLLITNFSGRQQVLMPNGKSLILSSCANIASLRLVVSKMLLWHRQGTDSICFEPVIGVHHKENENILLNQQIFLPPGETLTLKTEIGIDIVDS